MKKNSKQKLVKFEIAIAVIILLVGILAFFSYYSITGFVSVESKIQSLNMVIDNSQSFILTSNGEEPYTLTSMRISGEIIGEGFAELYLTDAAGKKILIYENIVKKTKAMSAITGMVSVVKRSTLYEKKQLDDLFVILPDKELGQMPKRTLAENEETSSGFFNNVCKDSCYLEIEMSKDKRYNIIANVEPGTIIKINEITITYII